MSNADSFDRDHALAIQSAATDLAHSTEIQTLRQEVRSLGQLVHLLLDAHISGLRLDPDAEPLKGLLRRSVGQPKAILGTVKCPACGAAVNDELGKTNERCVFCGAEVTTPR